MLFNRIKLRVRSLFYFIYYKLIYMRKYKVKRLPLVGKMFVVELIGKDSKINFEGKFYCRNNIYGS